MERQRRNRKEQKPEDDRIDIDVEKIISGLEKNCKKPSISGLESNCNVFEDDNREPEHDDDIYGEVSVADIVFGRVYDLIRYSGHLEQSDLIAFRLDGSVKIYYENETPIVYFLGPTRKIWQRMPKDLLLRIIANYLQDFLALYKQASHRLHPDLRSTSEESKKAEKSYYRLLKEVTSTSHCSSVRSFLVSNLKLRDLKLPEKLDSNINILSLAGPNVVDFTLCTPDTTDVSSITRERKADDYCSKSLKMSIVPNDGLDNTRIMSFLKDITLDRQDLIDYLQLIIGSSLLGKNKWKKMYVCYGIKSNGKSTLFNLIDEVLGEYYYQASKEVFIDFGGKQTPGAPKSHLHALKNRFLVTFAETKEDEKFNDDQVKAFTGNDKITCRRPHGEKEESFTPSFTPFIFTNNMPKCSTDAALWERVVMIPFDAYFTYNPTKPHERMRIDGLIDEIKACPNDLNVLFNWIIEGAIKAKNLKGEPLLPECVKKTTEKEKTNQDTVLQFKEERLEVDTGSRIQVGDIALRTLLGIQETSRSNGSWYENYKFKDIKQPSE
eukprot:gene4978-5789_t